MIFDDRKNNKMFIMENSDIQYDIYDPSHPIDSQYWQMGLVKSLHNSNDWKLACRYINSELPSKEATLFNTTKKETEYSFWGCLMWNNSYWIYRFFLTGRDLLSKQGRYFFILFKIQELDNLNILKIIRIIDYLESQTSIPLNLKPLQEKISEEKALFNLNEIQSILKYQINILFNYARNAKDNSHFAIKFKENKIIKEYHSLATPSAEQKIKKVKKIEDLINFKKNPFKKVNNFPFISRNIKNSLFFFIAGLIIGVVLGFMANKIIPLQPKPHGFVEKPKIEKNNQKSTRNIESNLNNSSK